MYFKIWCTFHQNAKFKPSIWWSKKGSIVSPACWQWTTGCVVYRVWPAEKMLIAMRRAYSASSRCRSFIPFENSKMGFMNSNWSPEGGMTYTQRKKNTLKREIWWKLHTEGFRVSQAEGMSLLESFNALHLDETSSLKIWQGKEQVHLLWRNPPYYSWSPLEM